MLPLINFSGGFAPQNLSKRIDLMDQNKILEILDFSPETEIAVKNILSKKLFSEIAKNAYNGEAPDYPVLCRKPLTRLAIIVKLLCEKYEDYKSLCVPEDIIAKTFRDVSLREKIYENKTGKPGISKDDALWFRHLINCEIFKIGVLQFQPFEMVYLDEELLGEAYMVFSSEQKENLPAGAQVINCHVPQGTDLSTDEISKSFSDAQTLFGKIYPKPEFKAFLCYSWLLYPDMTKLLPEDSKIKAFAKNFEIIGTVQDNEQAFENLFGKIYKRPPKIKNPTSLQKLAEENPKAFGFACGIINL